MFRLLAVVRKYLRAMQKNAVNKQQELGRDEMHPTVSHLMKADKLYAYRLCL